MAEATVDWHTQLCDTLIKARRLADDNGRHAAAAMIDMALSASDCPDDTVPEGE